MIAMILGLVMKKTPRSIGNLDCSVRGVRFQIANSIAPKPVMSRSESACRIEFQAQFPAVWRCAIDARERRCTWTARFETTHVCRPNLDFRNVSRSGQGESVSHNKSLEILYNYRDAQGSLSSFRLEQHRCLIGCIGATLHIIAKEISYPEGGCA